MQVNMGNYIRMTIFIMPKKRMLKQTTSNTSNDINYNSFSEQKVEKNLRIPRHQVSVYCLLSALNLPLIIVCTCPFSVPHLNLVLSHSSLCSCPVVCLYTLQRLACLITGIRSLIFLLWQRVSFLLSLTLCFFSFKLWTFRCTEARFLALAEAFGFSK